MEKIKEMKLGRQRKAYRDVKNNEVEDEMGDETEEDRHKKEQAKKLEILKIKESKLKRSISKKLKRNNK